jgi:hypothetical protein
MHWLARSLLPTLLIVASCGSKPPAAAVRTPPPAPTVPPRPPLPCFVDDGTPAGSAITLQLEASRVRGVAPLLVFFDTVGTQANATTHPFEELSYCWDFGDPTSGAFGPTGLPRNQAKGALSAHVFEKPGTYTVAVSVRDQSGRVTSRAIDVTVEDPEAVFAGSATTCFSGTGSFAGCPAGAEQVRSADLGEVRSAVASGKRLLLHRGESFSGEGIGINVPGPGIVGAYGTGDRPRISASRTVFPISNREPLFSDWRLMDLDIAGTSEEATVVTVNGSAPDLLLLRVRALRTGGAVMAADTVIDYHNENGYPGNDIPNVLGIQDCEFRELVGGGGNNLTLISARRLAILGTVAQDSTGGEHVLRLPYVDRGVLSGNDLGNAPSPRHVIKMHGPNVSKGTYTERVIISDNVIRGDGGHAWTVAITPQDDGKDERIRDIVIERNLFLAGTTQVPLIIAAQDVLVRGNVFNRGEQDLCVEIGQRGIEPAPTRVAVINNTCYSDDRPTLLRADSSTTNITAFNNLVVGPNADAGSLPSERLTSSAGNLVTDSPGFAVSSPGEDWHDYALTGTSPALDAADAIAVNPWDFSGHACPVDGDGSGSAEADVGAFEYVP